SATSFTLKSACMPPIHYEVDTIPGALRRLLQALLRRAIPLQYWKISSQLKSDGGYLSLSTGDIRKSCPEEELLNYNTYNRVSLIAWRCATLLAERNPPCDFGKRVDPSSSAAKQAEEDIQMKYLSRCGTLPPSRR